jgi:hypothetical protein
VTGIGTLRETALHASLKHWYAQPGDQVEASLDGCIVDILRGESVIEIQTHHFYAMRPKLERLLERRPVRLVYPVALQRWLVRLAPDGQTVQSRRKSPRRGTPVQVFAELVSFPRLVLHPNFTLELLLIHEEEVRCPQAPAARRRRRPRDWRVCDRRLLSVEASMELACPDDLLALLPPGLPQPFTNADLAREARQPPGLTEKMTYCLRHMGAIQAIGKRGRAVEYSLAH